MSGLAIVCFIGAATTVNLWIHLLGRTQAAQAERQAKEYMKIHNTAATNYARQQAQLVVGSGAVKREYK